jgi:hypothetical protein
VSGGNALLVVLVVAAAAVAGCGGKRDFRTAAQQACADARAHAGTTAASVAEANGRALRTVRGLDAPSGKDAQVRTLVAGLDQQHRALTGLRDGLARHARPDTLRDLTGAVGTQADLVAPTARALGVPACGTAPAALVDRLQAEDYAVQILSTVGRFDALAAAMPRVTPSQSRSTLRATADRAYHQFDPITSRLFALDPPQRFSALQSRLNDHLTAISDPYSAISDGVADRDGGGLRVTQRVRLAQRELDRARADWHALRAALPRVPARSVWGSTAVRVSAAEAHDEYNTILTNELYHESYTELPRDLRRWQDWRAVARDIGDQERRIARLDAPPDARSAQRMFVTMLHNAATAYARLADALEHHSRAALGRAQVAAHVADQQRREAQRRYRGAHYEQTLQELSIYQDGLCCGDRVHG